MGLNIERMDQMFARITASMDALQNEGDADIDIDETRIQEYLRTAPSVCLKWGRMATFAESQMERMGDVLKRVKSEVVLQVRKDMDAAGKKVTEAVVDAMVLSHPLYLGTVEQYRKAEELYGHIKHTASSAYARKDLLPEISRRESRELRDSFVQSSSGSPAISGYFSQGSRSCTSTVDPKLSDEELLELYRTQKAEKQVQE